MIRCTRLPVQDEHTITVLPVLRHCFESFVISIISVSFIPQPGHLDCQASTAMTGQLKEQQWQVICLSLVKVVCAAPSSVETVSNHSLFPTDRLS